MRTSLVFAISGAAMSLALVGCGASNAVAVASPTTATAVVPTTAAPTPTPTAAPVSIGQSLLITDSNSDGGAVTVTSLAVHTSPADPYSEKPANGYYLVVTIQFSVTTGSMAINPLYFAVQAPDGTTVDQSSGNAYASGYENGTEFGARTLAAGQKESGVIVFDAPSPHGAIVFQPGSTVIGSWTF